jgi:hypothetical protein
MDDHMKAESPEKISYLSDIKCNDVKECNEDSCIQSPYTFKPIGQSLESSPDFKQLCADMGSEDLEGMELMDIMNYSNYLTW